MADKACRDAARGLTATVAIGRFGVIRSARLAATTIDRRPAPIARRADASDLARCVRFAQTEQSDQCAGEL